MALRRSVAVGLSLLVALTAAVTLAAAPASAQATTGPSGDPSPSVPTWVDVEYVVEVAPGLGAVTLAGTAWLYEVDPGTEFDHVCETPCTADDLRQLYAYAGEEDRQRLRDVLEGGVEDEARLALASLAGASGDVTVEAVVDDASLAADPSGDPFQPPIPVAVTGTADVGIMAASGYTPEQIDALFDMAAQVKVPVEVDVVPGTALTVTLVLPRPISFHDAGQASTGPERTRATWHVDNTAGTNVVQLRDATLVGRADRTAPTAEAGELDVVLDLSDIDVHYANLLAGRDMATLDLRLQVQGSVQAVAIPEGLDPNVVLPYASADAIRIGLDAGLIDPTLLTGYEHEARQGMADALRDGFGIEAPIVGGFVEALLAPDAVGDPPGSGGPVLLELVATASVTLPPAAEQPGPEPGLAAFTVATIPLGDQLVLPQLPTTGGLEPLFTIILPPGVELAFDGVDGGEVQESTTDDGRRAYTFRSAGGSADGPTVQGAAIVVGSGAALQLLWPVLLALFLVFIVLPVLAIGLLVRRRRRRRLAAARARERPATQWAGPSAHQGREADRERQREPDAGEARGHDGS